MSDEPTALADFEAELQAVQETLSTAAEELGMPLGELVRAQAKQTAPALRAALVLAVAYDPQGDETSRQRRIFLAAALEMLAVALHIHRLLVTSASLEDNDDNLDKPFIGSTILAGDYCFSRAATMAAQTDSPRVVTLFAQALQTISEGHLRALSTPTEQPFDENHALLHTGATAAIELAGLPSHLLADQRAVAEELAAAMAQPVLSAPGLASLLPAALSERRPRWQALVHWLMGEHVNGWSTQRSTPS